MTEAKASAVAGPAALDEQSARTRRRKRTIYLTFWFGILGPAICFGLFDGVGSELFGRLSIPLRVAAASGLALLLLHVSGFVRSPRLLALLSGFLGASAVLAWLTGALLLPLTLVGLLVGIGLLGLIPFGTAWVLFRAAGEAWDDAAPLPPWRRPQLGVCGAALATLFPVGQPIAQEISYGIAFERLELSTSDAIERASDALDWVPCLSREPLLDKARKEKDEARFERLSRLCELQFGFPISRDAYLLFPD